MRRALPWLLLILFAASGQAHIRILTFHYNKPDFLELQRRALDAFMQEQDYELIAFNDAPEEKMAASIHAMCETLGIRCVRFEQEWHSSNPLNHRLWGHLQNSTIRSHLNFRGSSFLDVVKQPSVRHCHVIQYALDHFGYNHSDIVIILDGDMFPIRPIDVRSLMTNAHIVGTFKYIAEQDVGYFWVPFIAMNMPAMPDKERLRFHTDRIGNYIFDSGAHSYHYLRDHLTLETKRFSWEGSTSHRDASLVALQARGFTQDEARLIKELPWPQNVEFHIDKHFLHFAGSSFNVEGHDIKSLFLTRFVKALISSAYKQIPWPCRVCRLDQDSRTHAYSYPCLPS